MGVWPLGAAFKIRHRERAYTTLLMATGLTFGSISAQFGLTHHLIDKTQYTELVTVVILSAFVPTLIAQQFFRPRLPSKPDVLAGNAGGARQARTPAMSPRSKPRRRYVRCSVRIRRAAAMTHVIGPDFIGLQVRDLERSAAFYERELGLQRAAGSPTSVVAFQILADSVRGPRAAAGHRPGGGPGRTRCVGIAARPGRPGSARPAHGPRRADPDRPL